MLLRPFEHVVRFAAGRRGVESRTVETKAGFHNVYDLKGTGDLPPIVLLHGIAASAISFARVMLHLAPHTRRVFAPEAPGHGFSPAPRVRLDLTALFDSMADLLDRELSEPAIVFGNSLGGATALAYAEQRPEKVRALILCSPGGAHMEAAELPRLLQQFRMRSRRDANDFVRRLYHRPPWYTGLVAGDVRDLFASRAVTEILDSISPEDTVPADELRKLQVPLLFIWGQAEKVLPKEHLGWFRKNLPAHAEIVEPWNFGHCPNLDHPEELARMIVDFARRRSHDRE